MKKELKNILVPVDFNESSFHALLFASSIAKKINAKLIILYVIQIPGFLMDIFTSGEELVKLTDKTKEKLQEFIERAKTNGVEVEITSKVERGKPYEKILEVANEINARLIVLGENHQGDDASKHLGSTGYHVTLKSSVPVLTYKGDYENVNEKIIVPLDLTKQTKQQLFSAMVYGLNYGSKIYLVSALIGGIKIKNSRIYKKLKQAKKTLEENGVSSEIKLFERSETQPYKKVLEYSKNIKADMILVMTHQEGYTYDNYIGAFAHHIINESDVSVLSLTASASRFKYDEVLTTLVDPFGIFNK
ncbi:MAG: hypothetical protein C0597_04075 [Marinilabiliales bacterium]|nr:MAG: hypothetical protein C0597_04075 [Marinilabiliales bacterium]